MELEGFSVGIGTAGPGVAAAVLAPVGPCALLGIGAGTSMGEIVGAGEGESCTGPAGSTMLLALAGGSGDPDPPDGAGPGPGSGAVPGRFAASLQTPSVSTS